MDIQDGDSPDYKIDQSPATYPTSESGLWGSMKRNNSVKNVEFGLSSVRERVNSRFSFCWSLLWFLPIIFTLAA